jgi:hypothetical protein
VDFLVAKDDLHRCRFHDGDPPELEPGQALLSVDSLGLTSNNITYANFDEAMSYWRFFQRGRLGPHARVGFGHVTASRHDTLDAGARVYGYLPPSSELVVTPARVDARGFIDAVPHRAGLPPAYNGYLNVDADPVYDPDSENEQMLFRPLLFTSYLIDDFLDDADS